jgi:hypothetical protein
LIVLNKILRGRARDPIAPVGGAHGTRSHPWGRARNPFAPMGAHTEPVRARGGVHETQSRLWGAHGTQSRPWGRTRVPFAAVRARGGRARVHAPRAPTMMVGPIGDAFTPLMMGRALYKGAHTHAPPHFYLILGLQLPPRGCLLGSWVEVFSPPPLVANFFHTN